MLLRHFLISCRRVLNEKLYTVINVLGLALGISCFSILSIYIANELTYDEHFDNHERIYRVSTYFLQSNGSEANFALSAEGFGPLIVADYPQIEAFVRFRRSSENELSYEGTRFSWDDIYLVDENVFEVFDHEIVAGDPSTAFLDINSIAVSESFARSYFGEEYPIGKILEGNSFSYRVTLVFADLPNNTHLKYSALYPYRALSQFTPNYEDNYIRGLTRVGIFTYLLVNQDFDPGSFSEINDSFTDKYMTQGLARIDSTFRARLTPLNEVHYDNSMSSDLPNGNVFYLYGFSALAIAILLVACINYTNLATARATKRLKEIGVRKVLGASRNHLIGQFLGESLFFTILSFLFAIVLVNLALALSPFGASTIKDMLPTGAGGTVIYASIPVAALLVALLSGTYPALYLSSISPKALFTESNMRWRRSLVVRQFLVLVQLTTSIIVTAVTILMLQHLNFIASKPLGFDKENQVWIELRGADVIESFEILRNELIADPDIISVFDTSMVPGFGNATNIVYPEDNAGVFSPQQVDRIIVGLDYVTGFGIEVTEGRSFSRDMQTDASSTLMVNEALVRKMEWDDPIGKRIGLGGPPASVIGVTADFHYAPLNNTIGPLVIQPLDTNFDNLSEASRPIQRRSIIIKITGNNVQETLNTIEETIRNFDPNHVFNPAFLDERIGELYQSETDLLKVAAIFGAISIFISMMGIFGLTAFSVDQRRKEIGMRKVVGASSFQIVALICRGFMPIVLISIVPAVVVSFLTIDNWLNNYAYKLEQGIIEAASPYFAATIFVSSVALLTVSTLTLLFSSSNPVESIRCE